jgi:hypothetical protein
MEEAEVDKSYYWAIDMCKNIQSDLGIKPETHNDFKYKTHICSFKSNLNELKIEAIQKIKSVSLAYSDAEFKRKNDEIDNLVRKLKMEEIRPY